LRRSAAISGELAKRARRAHSAAWFRQYLAYDDIEHSLTRTGTRRAHSQRQMPLDRARHIISIYAPVRRIKRMIAATRISHSTVVLGSRIAQFGSWRA
jgi:hypothetical protein